MSIPTFDFRHDDADLAYMPEDFCEALIETKRFWRDPNNTFIYFKAAEDDFARVESKHMFRELLLTTGVIKLGGDLDQAAFDKMWLWMGARRWTFPKFVKPPRPRGASAADYLAGRVYR